MIYAFGGVVENTSNAVLGSVIDTWQYYMIQTVESSMLPTQYPTISPTKSSISPSQSPTNVPITVPSSQNLSRTPSMYASTTAEIINTLE